MAATATKTAVHVPCIEMAFKAILIPSIPDPATHVMKSQYAIARNSRPMRPPIMYPTSATESECRQRLVSAAQANLGWYTHKPQGVAV